MRGGLQLNLHIGCVCAQENSFSLFKILKTKTIGIDRFSRLRFPIIGTAKSSHNWNLNINVCGSTYQFTTRNSEWCKHFRSGLQISILWDLWWCIQVCTNSTLQSMCTKWQHLKELVSNFSINTYCFRFRIAHQLRFKSQ